MVKMIRRELVTYHPMEKEWYKFCITEQDKDNMNTFTKNQKIITAGKLIPKVKQYKSGIDEHCGESMNTAIRRWFADAGPSEDKQKAPGNIAALAASITQVKLALAVGHAVKVAYFKGPKTKDIIQIRNVLATKQQ